MTIHEEFADNETILIFMLVYLACVGLLTACLCYQCYKKRRREERIRAKASMKAEAEAELPEDLTWPGMERRGYTAENREAQPRPIYVDTPFGRMEFSGYLSPKMSEKVLRVMPSHTQGINDGSG